MRYQESEALCRHVKELMGERIDQFMRVVVWIEGERIELLDTLLLHSEGDGSPRTLQVFTDAHRQWSRWLAGSKDYTIEGEYGDRERDELQALAGNLAPVVPEQAYSVWETGTDTGQEYLIGIILVADGKPGPALNVHLDDVEITTADAFWRYVDQVLPQTNAIEIWRI
jgi:hypothetical protein